MAAVSLDTAELEVLLEATIHNRSVGMQLLNALRVKNSKTPYNSRFVDLSTIHDSAWRAALAGVKGDLGVA